MVATTLKKQHPKHPKQLYQLISVRVYQTNHLTTLLKILSKIKSLFTLKLVSEWFTWCIVPFTGKLWSSIFKGVMIEPEKNNIIYSRFEIWSPSSLRLWSQMKRLVQVNLRRYGVPHRVESINSMTIFFFLNWLNSIILSEYRSIQIVRLSIHSLSINMSILRMKR